MISVIIPTLNAEAVLVDTLAALVPPTVDGVVREVIIADCGSTDRTVEIADDAGARVLQAPKGRGPQMSAGADLARHPWLLFLHADSVLELGWEKEAVAFMARVDRGEHPPMAAAFRFALDDRGFMPWLIETGVRARCNFFRLPYGDQGLLIPRRLYDDIGGFRPIPLLEDVEIVRRLGRRRLAMLKSRSVTSSVRFRRDGYIPRVLRNWACLAMYKLGFPIERIETFYYNVKRRS